MHEGFELPVSYNNTSLNFPARLVSSGYSYKLEVTINGSNILFEPDEERRWRAMIAWEDLSLPVYKALSAGLLQAVAESIETILQ